MNTKRILIADAGATKTDWALSCSGQTISQVKTQGISPVHQDNATVLAILEKELKPGLSEMPDEIYFYGAGCTPDRCGNIACMLREAFGDIKVEVLSDLWGAARAVCGRRAGIACILGTGANSCLYDGHDILQNTPPLGYILGDEGSGAVMGKNFVADVLKGIMPQEIRDAFFAETATTYAEIIEHVYRHPLANRYLASFSQVVRNHREHPAVHTFLIDHFSRFIERNIRIYARPELPLNFVGGIAYSFRPELEEAARKAGMMVGKVERSPIEGLLTYHNQ
ncbi:MAG TPA: ATPase [Prevotellaceae bacterium]|nr:ATPase [Prevotellaceae bacterium]